MNENMNQKHRIPRKQPLPPFQKLLIGLMVILLIELVVIIHMEAKAYDQCKPPLQDGWTTEDYRWANLRENGVAFRQAPSITSEVVARYNRGICVEVVSVHGGWAEVLHYNHLSTGALYVRLEQLEFVD